MKNCSFDDWKMFMLNNNETTMFLDKHGDILSSLSAYTVFLSVLMYILSFLIVAPNFILIWGIRRTNKKLNIAKALFVYHSLTNSLMGLIALPYFALVMRLGLNCRHMAMANSIGLFSIIIGNMTVCQISFLRFLSIMKPFKEIDRDIVIAATFFEFATALFLAILNYTANVISIRLYPLQCIVSGTLITVCIFAAMLWNSLSMFFIRKQKMVVSDVSTQRNVRAIRRLSCISIAFGLCFLPTAVCYIYFGAVLIQQRIEADLFVHLYDVADLVFTPALICPGVTPFVYIAWDDSIKRYYRKLWCCEEKNFTSRSSKFVVDEVNAIRLKNFKTFSIK